MVSVRLDESFVADGKWWLGEHEHTSSLGWLGLGLDEGIDEAAQV